VNPLVAAALVSGASGAAVGMFGHWLTRKNSQDAAHGSERTAATDEFDKLLKHQSEYIGQLEERVKLQRARIEELEEQVRTLKR
jgi:uncharacterized protein HemX